jgi:predicted dehydrogenase
VRVAFVGAGPRANANAEALLASGAGSVAGVWDRTPGVATAFGERFSAPAFESVADLVERTRPDLVAVVTHPSHRIPPVAAAVAAGARALLVEKPLAMSVREVASLEQLIGDRFLAVNTQYPWMPHWRRILAVVAEGGIGELVTVHASTAVDLLDQGTHLLSLAFALTAAAGLGDAPDHVVAGALGTRPYGGVDGPAEIVAQYAVGPARITLTAGPLSPIPTDEPNPFFQQRVHAVGTDGEALVTLTRGGLLRTGDTIERFDTAWPRDDASSQTAFWRELGAAVADPDAAAVFPTRFAAAARQTRALFDAIDAAGPRA